MRPRSKLLSKRSVTLPTIREGAEETLRDLNEANTLHSHSPAVSSEDYLLSICHLAHPTFATRDVSFNNIPTKQQETEQQRLQLSRHSSLALPHNQEGEGGHSMNVQPRRGRELQGWVTISSSDPLEYLYGHHSDASGLHGSVGKPFEEGRFSEQRGRIWRSPSLCRTNSIPGASSPNFSSQRKSSCPQLHINTPNSMSNITAVNGQSLMKRERECSTNKENPAVKQSLISHWLSECRSAWREAQVRACMLPAIAET